MTRIAIATMDDIGVGGGVLDTSPLALPFGFADDDDDSASSLFIVFSAIVNVYGDCEGQERSVLELISDVNLPLQFSAVPRSQISLFNRFEGELKNGN